MKTRFTHTPTFGPPNGFSLFDEAFRNFGLLRNPSFSRRVDSAWAGAPEFAIEKTAQGWRLTADVAGLDAEALELQLHEDRLTVRAKRSIEVPEGFRATRRERSALAFEQSFRLRDADPEGVAANLKNGVLSIEVPKRAAAQPRAIAVKVD